MTNNSKILKQNLVAAVVLVDIDLLQDKVKIH